MRNERLANARAMFLSGLAILVLGLLITWGVAEMSGGALVVVTYGLIIVGGLRTLIGILGMLGALVASNDAIAPSHGAQVSRLKGKKWPARSWVPGSRTVGLLNLNVLGLGYLHQSRWVMWVFSVTVTTSLIYGLVRSLGNSVMTLLFVSLLVLWLVFSAILGYGAARKEIQARPSLPVRNDSRLQKVSIGLIAVQMILLLGLAIWWVLSVGSANKVSGAATELALSGDCSGAMRVVREMSMVQRDMIDSDSMWRRVEPICIDLLAAASAAKGGNYAKAQETYGRVSQRAVGIEGGETLRTQAYNGEAEATLLLAEKYLAHSSQQRNALTQYLVLLNDFPNSPASRAADSVVPDLSLSVAGDAVSAGRDPTFWYEQLVLHYPDSLQAEQARAALEDLK